MDPAGSVYADSENVRLLADVHLRVLCSVVALVLAAKQSQRRVVDRGHSVTLVGWCWQLVTAAGFAASVTAAFADALNIITLQKKKKAGAGGTDVLNYMSLVSDSFEDGSIVSVLGEIDVPVR